MAKGLRLTEKWMHRGLWLVALVFASFLIGLGATLVGDLPQVEKALTVEDFIDKPAANALRNTIKNAELAERNASTALEQAQLKRQVAQADTTSARETFGNWLSTRRATQLSDQDPELITRTKALDALKDRERAAGAAVEAQQQAALDAQQTGENERRKLAELERTAQLPAGCSSKNAKAPTGRLCGASSSLPALHSLWNWCRICRAMAVMCATSSVSW
jgi:hypothetical protein